MSKMSTNFGNLNLSKEVFSAKDLVKKLTQHAQTQRVEIRPFEEVEYNPDELLDVDSMDFSDDERWLYVSEKPNFFPFEGDLNEWLHDSVKDTLPLVELFNKNDIKRVVDSRTFTRPKKRLSRPSVEQLTDEYYSSCSSKSVTNESSFHSVIEDFNEQEIQSTAVVNFKLSEPISVSCFDRILANADATFDTFQNMSPPSLVNSLCSSTLMDTSYINQDVVPNDYKETKENSKYNKEEEEEEEYVENRTEINLSYVVDRKSLEDTFVQQNDQLNTTYLKTIESTNNSNNSTFIRKPKSLKCTFKASCPDINKTYPSINDDLDKTFQTTDSDLDMTQLKRAIYYQSMELLNPSDEIYHSARAGSTDSLDERLSSVSNSSKDSGSRIENMRDLTFLAKEQEQKLNLGISTPKGKPARNLFNNVGISPIQVTEDCLSDSDLSDICVTARSKLSTHNSSNYEVSEENSESPELNTTVTINSLPEVSQLQQRTVPTMVVKPLETNRRILPPRSQINSVSNIARPKLVLSGLPRPIKSATGIPRPASRLPGPSSKMIRPTMNRPNQKPPAKSNWMDGCY